MTADLDRRAALLASKLRALVTTRWGPPGEQVVASAFPDGAALFDPDGDRMWLLLGAGAERRVGAAMAVARRSGARELDLVVDDAGEAAIVARRAACFVAGPAVWVVEARSLVAAVPAPPAADLPPAPESELHRPALLAAGLVPVVEGGVLLGEVLGLEVGRVVVEPDGSAHVEAGVGRFDREVGAMMFKELTQTEALSRAAALVAELRAPGAARHPLNQLVPERWLRSVVLARPALVGASSLRPVGSALPRRNLTETGIATAVGVDRDGADVVVVCSTGVDLELVPGAADDRLTHAPQARLVLVVPERDAMEVTTELAAGLVHPADVVAVADGWTGLLDGGAA